MEHKDYSSKDDEQFVPVCKNDYLYGHIPPGLGLNSLTDKLTHHHHCLSRSKPRRTITLQTDCPSCEFRMPCCYAVVPEMLNFLHLLASTSPLPEVYNTLISIYGRRWQIFRNTIFSVELQNVSLFFELMNVFPVFLIQIIFLSFTNIFKEATRLIASSLKL